MTKEGPVPEGYDGREQAYVKHVLLEGYLEKLFFIIGSGMAPTGGSIELRYIDCFAGPWGDESESLKGTSIAKSLHTLDVVRQKLAKNGVSARIRALYIEKDVRAFGRLQAYLRDSTPEGVHAEAWNGDFVEMRNDLLRWTGTTAFAFFFIDPKGWTGVEVDTLKPLLARPRSEFLINFMYDFINRVMSMAAWQSDMSRLVGESVTLQDMKPSEREQAILNAYRSNLKRCVTATRPKFPPRSAHVRVLDRAKERPKYHLVYISSHHRGMIEFMTISESVEIVQRQVRAELQDAERERRTRTGNLFLTQVDLEVSRANASDVDRFWLEYIGEEIRQVDGAAFADILEDRGWFPGDLQASLVRLISDGRVRNLDAKGPRRKRPLHYEAKGGERLQLIGGSA